MKFENKIERGILHNHTQNSLFDSAMSVKELFDRAKELGAPAVMLSDHGTGTGFAEAKGILKKFQKKYGDMKLIYAVEFYVSYEALRAHLMVAAKNLTGYKGIIKLLTKANHNIDSQDMPIISFSDLEEFFGEGAPYHDSVLVTSACMAGVIATPLLSNFYIEKEIKKMERKLSTLPSPYSPDFLKRKEEEKEMEEKVEVLGEEVNRLNDLAKKPYKKRQNSLKKLEGDPSYPLVKANLEREMAESEEAARQLPTMKAEREKVLKEWRQIKKDNKKLEDSHSKFLIVEEAIKEKKNEMKNSAELYEIAKNEARKYLNLFGDNFYAELQNHRIAEEKYVMPLVAKIAEELRIPVIAANDAHMATGSENELKARQIMRSLRFNKWEEIDESDKELYLKTDAELYSILCEILPAETVEAAMVNVADFVSKCNVVHENKSHYPTFTSEIEGETAGERLRRLAIAGIEKRYPDRKGWTQEHEDRLNYELEVIHDLGYDDYLNIVEDFLTYGRLIGKLDPMNPDPRITEENRFDLNFLRKITEGKVGLGIGPGRGSGVGSLVCYLIGITGIDPLKYGLIFERFLNKERVSPPDIDSDIKSDIRDDVIQYTEWKYGGSDAVCGIMTKSTQQAKAAIRNCARLLGSKLCNDTTAFYDLGDRICKEMPEELGITLAECEVELREKFGDNGNAITIIDNAKLVEGTFTNVGVHAAGVVIADNGDISSYLPLMYVKGKDRFVTQADKNEVEAENLLKMDFLGLKNLKIITDALQMIQKRTGKSIDIETVDVADASVYKRIFASGNTNSVFQFESPGMKNLLKRFKPEKMEHLTLLNALYRPGPLQYIDPIIDVKNGKTTPDYVIPEMEKILGETFGHPVYQEQIIKIFNEFAGFSLGEADIIRRAMAKKHLDELTPYKGKFIEGLCERGAKLERAEAFWEELLKFSEYAFNKSHSCAYSHVAYYTAYLKHYYPREYYAAVMNTTTFDKIGSIITECRQNGITVRQVDVNASIEKFSILDDSIIYGMGLVKEIGNSASAIVAERKARGPYTSLLDFILRTKADKTTIENLIFAGAFDSLCKNRTAALHILPQYLDILKKIKTQEKTLDADDTAKADRAREKIENLLEDMRSLVINLSESENHKEKLAKEREITDCYLSSHPLDYYDYRSEKVTEVASLKPDKHSAIIGVITNLKITKRKSDGKEMAFFDLEDKTGSIHVCCFAANYENYKDVILEGNVVKIEGSVSEERRGEGEDEDLKLQLNVKAISSVKEKVEKLCIQVRDIEEWVSRVYDIALCYQDDNGYLLVVFDKSQSEFRESTLYVSKDILNDVGVTGFFTM